MPSNKRSKAENQFVLRPYLPSDISITGHYHNLLSTYVTQNWKLYLMVYNTLYNFFVFGQYKTPKTDKIEI